MNKTKIHSINNISNPIYNQNLTYIGVRGERRRQMSRGSGAVADGRDLARGVTGHAIGDG